MIWSRLKKATESLFEPALRIRVALRSTNYRQAHDQEGRVWITVDGEEIWSASDRAFYVLERERMMLGKTQAEVREDLMTEGIFKQSTFYDTLEEYVQSGVDRNLESRNPLHRALSVLDRRVGARRLREKDISAEHPLVRRLYDLRMSVAK
jgi:hypothetical protein